ncbi:MAG: alpha/beta fold hydrolase [Deltaproteobacteria bacterium]|nr:alpha/beta fold hydrolase [Deltaproteobacteria bacterium]
MPEPRARPRGFAVVVAAAGVLLVSGGCAAPVRVHRADSRVVDRELTRSVTATGELSQDTHNVLHRWGMLAAYATGPDEVIDVLHRALVDGREGPDVAFALAELSFHHAERGHKGSGERWRRTGHYLATAVYAYAFLFPEDPRDVPNRFDPRVRRAADLYNRGCTLGLPSADGRTVAIRAGRYPLPFGAIDIAFDERDLRWGDRRLETFVPSAELMVSGLTERYRRSGLGVPLAAGTKPLDASKEPDDFIDPATRVPVTAILRVPTPRTQLAREQVRASLELYDATAVEEVTLGDRTVPLEVEPTAAFAYMLAEQKFWDFELKSLLGTAVLGKDPMRLTAVQPWRRGRIPVVLVHGTGSSPGRWADMVNDLMDDPVIRDRFQFWFFTYDSGNPILYSAGGLRDLLTAAVARLDPDGADPALRRMVVIGHSQGGLITKLTAVDSGDKLWGFRTRLDDMLLGAKSRELLRRLAFVTPLPFVKRVVFVATPHRGSYVAGNWMAHQFARLITMPSKILDAGAEIAKGNPDFANWRVPSAVENMTPGHPFVRALGPMPIDPGVACHSIVAVKTDPPYEGGTDGVVRYESAHRTDCASEVVVKSPHSCQSNPATIAEVRRILLVHLGDPRTPAPPIDAPRLPGTP